MGVCHGSTNLVEDGKTRQHVHTNHTDWHPNVKKGWNVKVAFNYLKELTKGVKARSINKFTNMIKKNLIQLKV